MEDYKLDTLQSIAAAHPNDTHFSSSLVSVQDQLRMASDTARFPEVQNLHYLTTGTLEQILSLRSREGEAGSEEENVHSLAGGRDAMQTMIQTATALSKCWNKVHMWIL